MIKSKPKYPYQLRVNQFSASHPRVGIFTFFGSGKTYMSLEWLEAMRKLGNPFPVLILTLKCLIDQWGDEIEKHSDFTYCKLDGNTKSRADALTNVTAQIYLLNYDAVQSPPVLNVLGISKHTRIVRNKRKVTFRWTGKTVRHFRAIICDESTHLKESRTQRYKAWKQLVSNSCSFRALLTGLPLTERAEELWSQVCFLDDGRTFGNSFWKFRSQYFVPGPSWKPYEWTLRIGAAEEIGKLAASLCIRIPKSEIEEQLPPRGFIKVLLKLPDGANAHYKELKKQFALELPSGNLFETQWAVVKYQKLCQVCQGFIYNSEHQMELIHTLKLDWLRTSLPSMLQNGSILIWSSYQATIQLIESVLIELKIPFATHSGEQKQEEKTRAIKNFQQGHIQVLNMMLTEKSGGAGLNLQQANQSIFFNNNPSLEVRENAQERNHRLGSEIHDKVTVWDLIMLNTVDEVIFNAFVDKRDVSEAVLKHIKEE